LTKYVLSIFKTRAKCSNKCISTVLADNSNFTASLINLDIVAKYQNYWNTAVIGSFINRGQYVLSTTKIKVDLGSFSFEPYSVVSAALKVLIVMDIH